MLEVRKQFSETDYLDNDRAYNALVNSKSFKSLFINQRKEDYGIDIDVFLSKEMFNANKKPIAKLELEVKHNWESGPFPFKDVQFLAKKTKHLKQEAAPFWVMFNSDCTNCGVILMEKITLCELDIVWCKGGIGNDYFYRIPKDAMVWGLNNVEKYLLYIAFNRLNNEHRNRMNVHF